MLDALTEGLVLLDATGRILEWNAAAEIVLGLTGDQLGGRTPMDPRWEAIHPDGTPWPGELHPSMIAATTGQVMPEAVMGVRRPVGDLVWIRVNARPLHDDDGSVIGALAAFLDVTATVDLERRTDTLAQQLHAAITSGGTGTALLDGDDTITFANAAFAHIVNAPSAGVVGMTLHELLDPLDPASTQIVEQLSSDTCDLSCDVRLRRTSADQKWINLSLSSFPSNDGSPCRFVQIADVTSRYQLQLQIERSEELARTCLDALDQGVMFASPSLGIMRANPAITKLLGYTATELFREWMSHDWSMHDQSGQRLPQEDFVGMRAIATGETFRDQIVWVRHLDGHWIRTLVSAVPFGWTDEVVLIFTDITSTTPPDAPRPPASA